MLSRRGFLGLFGSAAVAATVDPERLLWVPGAKTISIPSPSPVILEPEYQPKLYQVMTSVNWREFVNDDLGIFKDLSSRLSIAQEKRLSAEVLKLYGVRM